MKRERERESVCERDRQTDKQTERKIEKKSEKESVGLFTLSPGLGSSHISQVYRYTASIHQSIVGKMTLIDI